MSLNDQLVKIEITGNDFKGVYLKDTFHLFDGLKIIGKNELKKVDYLKVCFVLKFYHSNKTIKKTFYYKNVTGFQAARKALFDREIMKEEIAQNGLKQKKKSETLDFIYDSYMQTKKTSLSPQNIYSMSKSYDRWIKPSIGAFKVDRITTADIQKIVNKMLSLDYAPRSTLYLKQILRPCFNFAIGMNYCENNPAIKVEIPSFDNTVDFELSEDQRKKLYTEIKNYEIMKYRGIMLFLFIGRRLNEVLTLRWENINFENEEYTIIAKYSKIRRNQAYPLIDSLKKFLANFGIEKYGFVFKGVTTDHVSSSTLRPHWNKVLLRADIKKMRLHDTRHLLGNFLVNAGETLENIGPALGHGSVSVTKRYSKTNNDTKRRLLDIYSEGLEE